jgi:hypothetical protein
VASTPPSEFRQGQQMTPAGEFLHQPIEIAKAKNNFSTN